MLKFLEYINEVFDSHVPITLLKSNERETTYRFEVPGVVYNIDINRSWVKNPRGGYNYDISFGNEVDSRYTPSGKRINFEPDGGSTDKPFSVYGTFMQTIIGHFKKHKLAKNDQIEFSGWGGSKQEKIYDMFAERIASALKMKHTKSRTEYHIDAKKIHMNADIFWTLYFD